MGAIIQGAGTSELRWDAQQLVICLPRQIFGANLRLDSFEICLTRFCAHDIPIDILA